MGREQPGAGCGQEVPGAVGGSHPAAHAEGPVGLQSGRPPRGTGPWDPGAAGAPRLERLEMGKIHSRETETIKGAEETHKEV